MTEGHFPVVQASDAAKQQAAQLSAQLAASRAQCNAATKKANDVSLPVLTCLYPMSAATALLWHPTAPGLQEAYHVSLPV